MNEGDLIAGKYRLLRQIGAGAMGSVWAARHELLGRDFAIKFATLPRRSSSELRSRFLQEARIVGQLRHPNIVDVVDVGESEVGDFYLAMELLDGVSLSEHLSRAGPLDPRTALTIAREMAAGLAAAHEAGIVHRDVKPENVFLARSPAGGTVVKLLDFGVSKGRGDLDLVATMAGALFGTPAYMSPEQALGETTIDHRTDLWSFGVVLFEMLTSKHPFAASNYQALIFCIAEEPPAPLPESVPQAIRDIVSGCLTKRCAERVASAGALLDAIDDALETLPPGNTAGFAAPLPVLPSLSPQRRDGALGTFGPSMQSLASQAARRRIGVVLGVVFIVAFGGWLAVRGGREAPVESAALRLPSPAATGGGDAALPSASVVPARTPIPVSSASADASAAATPTAPSGSTRPSGRPSATERPRPAAAKRPVSKVNDVGF